nr:MAG TPA: hypothetical protein [Caudoviricetes sp.]
MFSLHWGIYTQVCLSMQASIWFLFQVICDIPA